LSQSHRDKDGNRSNRRSVCEPVLQSNGYYEFIDHHSGLCLNFPSTSNGQQLQINTCNGSSSEMFKLNEL